MKNANISFKSGYVVVIGRPNVGKSTLINTLMNQKIAAVSPRPQTTRRRQLGILTLEDAQIIFVDTPGIHIPHHRLGEIMNQTALDSLSDADMILWIVDASNEPNEEDKICAENIRALKSNLPVILALNKTDLISQDDLFKRQEQFQSLLPGGKTFPISATIGFGVSELLDKIFRTLPEGPLYYEGDQVTDYYERDIAIELIREAALLHLRDEVPHCLAVRLDEYRDRDQNNSYIKSTLFIEKESQKGIVIGKGGEMLKKIGTTARKEIEWMTGRKVYLELRVKVSKNWRNSDNALKMMGYAKKN